ncbi:unnamed protein product [Arabis nemorensis]|uniref:Pectinesterase inhibitor domain-containing protein n=1 Tax=Arabis nemorensis TaxID=586526 RepID=A0A565BAK5_9BRAS|nr:unnamed protein product [Arabis nemorensis]
MLAYLNSVIKDIIKPDELKKYDICVDAYNSTVHNFLPAALDDLNIFDAVANMQNIVTVLDNCESQFAGSSPFTGRNKVVHDIADMSADIIRYLYGN